MSSTQFVLSADQINTLRADLVQLGEQAGIRFVILADLSGHDIVSFDASGNRDISTITTLAASDMMATLEIGQMLGSERACNLIVQEHDDQTVLISRVGQRLLLVVSTTNDVPLGWSRLAIKRVVDRVLLIVGAIADTPLTPAASDDSGTNFTPHLNTIW